MSDASLSRTFARNLDHLLRLQDLSRIAAAEAAQVPYKWLRRAVTQDGAHTNEVARFVTSRWRLD